MTAAGVRRYIGLATPSIRDQQDRPTLRARALPVGIALSVPNALLELRGMSEAVMESELDRTLARISFPHDRPPTGRVRAGFLGRDRVGWLMSRADIAGFLVDQLSDDTFIRAAPAISN